MPPKPPKYNLVPFRDYGLVIALQYWKGDQAEAFRLARLIADIEPAYRADVTLVLAGRFDVDGGDELFDLVQHCNAKMRTFPFKTEYAREGATGHPDGANRLWLGTMLKLAALWWSGDLDRANVFTVEADGCPLDADWINRIKAEHQRTLDAGKRITGAFMPRPMPHINGSLVVSIPWFVDCNSIQRTPLGEAWDVFHRETIMAVAAPSQEIRNVYGATEWLHAQLEPLGKQSAWLASTKDDSAIAWAERCLVEREPELARSSSRSQARPAVPTLAICDVEQGYAHNENPPSHYCVNRCARPPTTVPPGAAAGIGVPPSRLYPNEPCAGCLKVLRHPGEGYECMWHPPAPVAAPTTGCPPDKGGK